MTIPQRKKIIFVASGSGGCRILSKVDNNLPKLFINKDPDLAKMYSGLTIGVKTNSEDYNIYTRYEEGETAAIESKDEILKHLESYDLVVLIAPLCGGVSSGIAVKLAEFLFSAKKPTKILAQLPLDFERIMPYRYDKALESYEYLSEFLETVLIQNYRPHKSVSLADVYNIQDEDFLYEIEKILQE